MENGTSLPPEFSASVESTLQKAEQRIEERGYGYLRLFTIEPTTPAEFIDHTILKPEATEEQVLQICDEAKEWGFKAVCVRPNYVSLVAAALKDTPVEICSVVCFPEGTQSTEEKLAQGKSALSSGAQELDYVINYPQLLAKEYAAIYSELRTLVCHLKTIAVPASGITADTPSSPTLKLILETSQLSRADIVAGTLLAVKAGFDFVKTSTGFLGHGAKEPHVRLMREICDMCAEENDRPRVKVKASGGIKDFQDAMIMIDSGADRLGVSRSVAIMKARGAPRPSRSAD